VPAKEFLCKVLQVKWLTPTVIDLRFEPSKKFNFEPGQFISVVVPDPKGGKRPLRRAYSLAVPPEQGWGLCVKVVPGGPGSNYVASLKPGDIFKAFAPYGDFVYDHESGRDVCFISTGTGVAPFLAMIHSTSYRDNLPERATNIFGARTEEEIIFPGYFARLGLIEVNAISQPSTGTAGGMPVYKGRVTDYIKGMPSDWGWDMTDFYVCGNGEMVAEVRKLLRARGVSEERIHQEVYFVAPDRLKKPAAQAAAATGTSGQVTPPPFKHGPLIKKAG
jgi:ferredoxin-NADP reductase